jgi:hypothetical protein
MEGTWQAAAYQDRKASLLPTVVESFAACRLRPTW